MADVETPGENISHDDQVKPVGSDLPPDEPRLKKSRKRPSFDNPPLEEGEELLTKRAELARKWEIVKYALELKARRDRLPRGVGQMIRKELGIGSREGLRKLFDRVTKYHRDHPDDPPENAIVDLKPGRLVQAVLSTKEEEFFIISCLKTDWPLQIPGGEVKEPAGVIPELKFVYNLLVKEHPHLKDRVTLRQLKGILDRHKRGKDALSFILSWNGARAVKESLAFKVDNDAEAPDERWISDARYLPIFVRVGKIICTVVLVVIMDDYSRYVLDWFILPRKVEVALNDLRNVDFTNKHLRGRLSYIMDKTKRRARTFYTDNGSQYKALAKYMQFIARDNQSSLHLIRSKPDEPWGRGKVEVLLKLVDKTLKDIGGYIKNSRSLKSRSIRRTEREFRLAWKHAHAHPEELITIEQLRLILEEHFKQWNASPAAKNRPTRQALWEGAVEPSIALPPPNDIDLAQFAFAAKTDTASISDTSLRKDCFWEPATHDPETRQRWMAAVARKERIPICFFSPIRGQRIVIACVDGKNWERVVPKGTNRFSGDGQSGLNEAGIELEDQVLKLRIKRLEDQLIEKYGDLPRKTPVTQEVKLPDPKPQKAESGTELPPTDDSALKQKTRSRGAKAAKKEKTTEQQPPRQGKKNKASSTHVRTPGTETGTTAKNSNKQDKPSKGRTAKQAPATSQPEQSVPSAPEGAGERPSEGQSSIERMRQLRAQLRQNQSNEPKKQGR
ncbi:MAG TPA: hypothetical protein VFZ66_21275 [Herpetosiphonaceae bacterium]